MGFALGDLLGFSKVSAPNVGLAFVFVAVGAVRPLHVFLDDGGNLGVNFGDVWTGLAVCFGLGVLPRLGVRFLTGECGILLAGRLLTVLGDSTSFILRLLLGESLLSVTIIRSELLRIDLSSTELVFRPP